MSNSIYYHYTTIAGCHSIIAFGKVWFTDHRFLNDKYELKQGISALLAHLEEIKKISFKMAFDLHLLHTHHCVLSLSKCPKILSQWRAYAADGTGVAIGFSDQLLKSADINLVECEYEDCETFTENLATKYGSFIDSVHLARLDGTMDDFIRWITQHTGEFTAMVVDLMKLKNPAFVEENEIRAIWSRNYGSSVMMRLSNQLMIPYIEAELWESGEKSLINKGRVIHEIWLGPKCDSRNEIALKALCIPHCCIEKYDCGYV